MTSGPITTGRALGEMLADDSGHSVVLGIVVAAAVFLTMLCVFPEGLARGVALLAGTAAGVAEYVWLRKRGP